MVFPDKKVGCDKYTYAGEMRKTIVMVCSCQVSLKIMSFVMLVLSTLAAIFAAAMMMLKVNELERSVQFCGQSLTKRLISFHLAARPRAPLTSTLCGLL